MVQICYNFYKFDLFLLAEINLFIYFSDSYALVVSSRTHQLVKNILTFVLQPNFVFNSSLVFQLVWCKIFIYADPCPLPLATISSGQLVDFRPTTMGRPCLLF
jgi:hypothetical protein